MAIDINELRRLTQAALAGPDGISLNWIKLLQDFQQKASPSAISELLNRLEAAESECLEQARLNGMGGEREAALLAKLEAAEKDIAIKEEVIDSLAAVIKRLDAQCDAAEKSDAESIAMYRKARDERDALRAENAGLVDDMNLLRDNNTALRARIKEMEKQESVATVIKEGDSRYWMSERLWTFPDGKYPLYALPGAQQCKNCNGMGDCFDPSGEKIPCDLCESHLEEIRSLVAEAAHDIISGSDFWLSISLAAKKIYALPGAQVHPAPSVHEGFSREDLEAVADGLDGYEKTVNVGNVTGGGDDHLESTTAYAARFIRAMLAAPETKP